MEDVWSYVRKCVCGYVKVCICRVCGLCLEHFYVRQELSTEPTEQTTSHPQSSHSPHFLAHSEYTIMCVWREVGWLSTFSLEHAHLTLNTWNSWPNERVRERVRAGRGDHSTTNSQQVNCKPRDTRRSYTLETSHAIIYYALVAGHKTEILLYEPRCLLMPLFWGWVFGWDDNGAPNIIALHTVGSHGARFCNLFTIQ